MRSDWAFRILLIAGLPLFVLLLPVLLPIALAGDAVSERRLARTRCGACGREIGLAEIRRAKREAAAQSSRTVQGMIARGLRPRMVAIWRIRCPGCGADYRYRSDSTGGLEAVEAT